MSRESGFVNFGFGGMNVLLFVLIFYSEFSFGQKSRDIDHDSVRVEELIPGETHMICQSGSKKKNHPALSGLDSMKYCYVSKTFKTDHIDVYYIKEYDFKGKLRQQGYAKKFWVDRKMLGIKFKPVSRKIEKEGAWEFFDEKGFKISDCCYKKGIICNGCVWTEFDDQGYKKREYKIDW